MTLFYVIALMIGGVGFFFVRRRRTRKRSA
ncbi:MAG: hypothetical protein DMF85_00965 [Acidobacteria bacterium]|nr:MAG: hypothetical protein DMF85_00965 [Acidobacteriota bacterium]PYR73675.1 MAG: hypothetical protein DMF86_19930 [Acidobacteriota bacterium]